MTLLAVVRTIAYRSPPSARPRPWGTFESDSGFRSEPGYRCRYRPRPTSAKRRWVCLSVSQCRLVHADCLSDLPCIVCLTTPMNHSVRYVLTAAPSWLFKTLCRGHSFWSPHSAHCVNCSRRTSCYSIYRSSSLSTTSPGSVVSWGQSPCPRRNSLTCD